MEENKLKNLIIDVFLKEIPIIGNKYGKLDNLGNSGLTRNFDEYIFSIPYRLEKFIQKSSGWDVPDAAIPTLIEASRIFGFFTFAELLTSKVWHERIAAELKCKMDWFKASIYLLNTFGYGVYEILDNNDDDNDINITIRLNHSVEAELYKRWYGISQLPKCYLSRGVLSSITNLIFSIDIESNPFINIDLYEKIFMNDIHYTCIEKECSAQKKIDNACIFFINKNNSIIKSI